jgi:uncharacterized membrane protein YdjX (TVP38/TMEM64 family)
MARWLRPSDYTQKSGGTACSGRSARKRRHNARVKKLNPIYLLIALNLLLFLFRTVLLPEDTTAAIASGVEATLVDLGVFGYITLIASYGVCGFFFVPLMIPLNILGGALYGASVGTAIALAGITLS